MSDLIRRQDAIASLKEEFYPVDDDYGEGYEEALKKAIWIVEKWLPSAQPEDVILHITDKRKFVSKFDFDEDESERTGWVHIDDIYRLISGHSNYHGDNILAALTCLAEGKEVLKPITVLDTQPEIIRCKNCKKYDTHDHRCKHWNHGVVVMDWCSRAERRSDETD